MADTIGGDTWSQIARASQRQRFSTINPQVAPFFPLPDGGHGKPAKAAIPTPALFNLRRGAGILRGGNARSRSGRRDLRTGERAVRYVLVNSNQHALAGNSGVGYIKAGASRGTDRLQRDEHAIRYVAQQRRDISALGERIPCRAVRNVAVFVRLFGVMGGEGALRVELERRRRRRRGLAEHVVRIRYADRRGRNRRALRRRRGRWRFGGALGWRWRGCRRGRRSRTDEDRKERSWDDRGRYAAASASAATEK